MLIFINNFTGALRQITPFYTTEVQTVQRISQGSWGPRVSQGLEGPGGLRGPEVLEIPWVPNSLGVLGSQDLVPLFYPAEQLLYTIF